MTSHPDNPKRGRLRRTKKTGICRTDTDGASAKVIRLRVDRPSKARAPKTTPSPQLKSLLTVLRTEVMIAAGISQDLREALDRFHGYITAIDSEIARGEVLQLQATVLKQTAHLRAIVLATSADLQRVLPGAVARICDVQFDRSDLIYS